MVQRKISSQEEAEAQLRRYGILRRNPTLPVEFVGYRETEVVAYWYFVVKRRDRRVHYRVHRHDGFVLRIG